MTPPDWLKTERAAVQWGIFIALVLGLVLVVYLARTDQAEFIYSLF